jgi:hypothetical protein
MSEVAALLTSFSHLQNIAKALLNLRDFEKLNATVIELQGIIITAQQQAIAIQQSHAALETKTHNLEAECMSLKEWRAEKQKYTCREIAIGRFAYVENGIVDNFQSAHKYCPNCFDEGKKSLLQQPDELYFVKGLNCPGCKTKLQFSHYLFEPKPSIPVPT